MRRKKHWGLCSHQPGDKTSQGARYGGEGGASEREGERERDWQQERRERKETANLPGAFWEMNLAGEISSATLSGRDNPSLTERRGVQRGNDPSCVPVILASRFFY